MSKTDAAVSLKDFAASTGAAPAEPAKKSYPDNAYVRVKAPTSELHHVHTGVVFNADPKKVDIDDFVKAQLEVDKLEIVPA